MNRRKYWIGAVLGIVAIVGMAATAFATVFPAPTACIAIEVFGFEEVSERFFVPPNSSRSQIARYEELIQESRRRITLVLGKPEAQPIVVFFEDPRSFAPLFLNEVGQAPSVGKRACLIIGPRGQNVDVVAHELMHAEMHYRIGPWKMLWEIPAWFDEGVAMQVDFRERFIMSPDDLPDTSYVRKLKGHRAFFAGEHNYAAARREVADLLDEYPANTLYANIERIRSGETFAQVFE